MKKILVLGLLLLVLLVGLVVALVQFAECVGDLVAYEPEEGPGSFRYGFPANPVPAYDQPRHEVEEGGSSPMKKKKPAMPRYEPGPIYWAF